MRMYADLAEWWPLLSPPSHYPEEAAHLLTLLPPSAEGRLTLLELGSGGGSLAFHLKDHFRLTLTDVSTAMLAVSRAANPGVEHIQGDMRTLALGRQFDVVLIHDAISYMLDLESLGKALGTAARHCRPGGTVVVLPDEVRESYQPGTHTGGEDGADGRALRYLEWSWDPDPADTATTSAYAFVLREADGSVRHVLDIHHHGLFAQAEWLAAFDAVGLSAQVIVDPWERQVFVSAKR